jgi:uncharacterized protein (DUF433 family)
MNTIQKSLRIPQETALEIEKISQDTGQDFSAVTKDLLTEAIKTRRCPGIVFIDGVSGRRAKVAGSGIDVWEIVATYKSLDQNIKRLEKAYHWLTQQQLKSAIGYYFTYRKEIDELIARNNSWTSQSILDRYPVLIGDGM